MGLTSNLAETVHRYYSITTVEDNTLDTLNLTDREGTPASPSAVVQHRRSISKRLPIGRSVIDFFFSDQYVRLCVSLRRDFGISDAAANT